MPTQYDILPNVSVEEAEEQRSVGRRLKQVREQLGLGQVAFSDKMRVSLRAYSAYENGTRSPKLASLCRLHALGVDLNWLLCGDGQPFGPAKEGFDRKPRGEDDGFLLAKVTTTVAAAFEAEGLTLDFHQIGQMVASEYIAIMTAADDAAERQVMIKLVAIKIRQQLKANHHKLIANEKTVR